MTQILWGGTHNSKGEKDDFSPGKAHFFFVSVTFSTGSGSKKVVQEIFFEFGLHTCAFSIRFFFNAFVYTCVHYVQRSQLEAFCMFSYLIVSSTLRGKPPYTTDKETKLQRSQVTSSDLPS